MLQARFDWERTLLRTSINHKYSVQLFKTNNTVDLNLAFENQIDGTKQKYLGLFPLHIEENDIAVESLQ